jgi:predicted metal-dependent hydrolase
MWLRRKRGSRQPDAQWGGQACRGVEISTTRSGMTEATPTLPGMQIEIRRSPRARRATLTVAPFRSAELVVPARMSDRQAQVIIERNRGWIERRLDVAREAEAAGLGLQRDGVIWLDGTAHPTRLAGVALERRYRGEARSRFERSVTDHAERLSLSGWRRIAIRDQRTRWGSCSTSGTLSFNWRLAMAPPSVLDYVVVHELCHLRRRDHSNAFWELVERSFPGHREQRGWLRRHGHELLAYRV